MTHRLLTVCGSFHPGSANAAALAVAQAYLQTELGAEVRQAPSIEPLPALNPTLVETPPEPVACFQAEVQAADAVLLAAPEYAGGMAGSLKNALDWCVGSASFYQKPAVVISAGSTGGLHARHQLVRTLVWQGAQVVGQLGITAPRTKSDASGRFTDPATLRALEGLAAALVESLSLTPEARAARTLQVAAELSIHDSPHAP